MSKIASLNFQRVFSSGDPYVDIQWDHRTAEITDDNGKIIFKQEGVEVPKAWSELATKVVVSKYFYGEQGTSEREKSVGQLIHRVCRTIADWGVADGYFNKEDGEIFFQELSWLCLNQYLAFNSPVWFNVGLHHQYQVGSKSSEGNWFYDRKAEKAARARTQYEYPQASACFIQSVDDNMEDIMRLAYSEAMLFKFGSGTGSDLSTIRSSKEKLSGGGRPSGPLSFLRIYDQVANVVKSGGKTRRAAKMNTLKDWHGDVEEFICCKQKEEKKAWALIEQGYNGSFNGEAYGTVAYQNENLSVRVSDEFMEAAVNDKEWWTRAVTTGKPIEKKSAKDLLWKISEGTHVCGDPGLQYDGAIQKWHTCSGTEPIHSTNPCCFTAETLILTGIGYVRFDQLQLTDPELFPGVVAYDFTTRKFVERQIRKVWVSGTTKRLVDVKFGDLVVRCTPEHRFILLDGSNVKAKDLTPSHAVIQHSPSGPATRHVTSVTPIQLDSPVNVFDMEVDTSHNFLVTNDPANAPVLVHNSEYVFLNNTACNLASLNLMKFKNEDGSFNIKRFKSAVRLAITAQEILVDNASYPTEEIAVNSHIFRTLGLGYANLGCLLMSYGLPYDSDAGRALAGSITAVMTGEAYRQSALISAKLEAPFPGYRDARCAGVPTPAKRDNVDSMTAVIQRHRAALSDIHTGGHQLIPDIVSAARESWDEAYNLGQIHGFRNAQVTVLAPTGTIAFMMDCDTTGVEPDIALVKYKLLAGGGVLKIVNKTVAEALRCLGYDDDAINKIIQHIDRYDTIEDVGDAKSGLKPDHLPVFDCAFKPAKGKRSIHYRAHILMMAAAQPFISGAISKTVNLPNQATIEDIQKAYVEAWKLGLKCVAIYRDGSKRSQPLNTDKKDATDTTKELEASKLKTENTQLKTKLDELAGKLASIGITLAAKQDSGALRRKLPNTRMAVTHKFSVAGHEGYLTVGCFEDGTPGELFITMAKEGSTVGGLMDTIGTLTSIALQYGVPLQALADKFKFQRFEPSGFTQNPDIKTASSTIDYVFRWMEQEFLVKKELMAPKKTEVDVAPSLPAKSIANISDAVEHFQLDAPSCPNCGHVAVRNGACYKCLNCGESLGCS